MKVYNITDTKKFFETLRKCTGNVDVVNDEGKQMSLIVDGHESLSALAAAYVKGTIEELELHFSKPQDIQFVAQYLVAM